MRLDLDPHAFRRNLHVLPSYEAALPRHIRRCASISGSQAVGEARERMFGAAVTACSMMPALAGDEAAGSMLGG